MVHEHVYKLVELAGASKTSVEDAIDNALMRAGKTLNYLDWFEVTELRGSIEQSKVRSYQVVLKVGFKIEDDDEDN